MYSTQWSNIFQCGGAMPKRMTRADCTPDAPIPLQVKTRRYTGPLKGSQEAKDRMARVRAAQWAKNGLVVSQGMREDAGPPPTPVRY